MDKNTGTLYMVATPIGNLEDITYRAVRVLSEVDVIAAEDTRQTSKLLNHFGIKRTLISYHEHNKLQRGGQLTEMLLSGKNIAVVTDAGTPGISDPGEDLVNIASVNNIEITIIPGCCAAISALVLSGLPTGRFVFEGFLPHQKKERRLRIQRIKDETRTIIYYESPHRIKDTLTELYDVLGDRRCSVVRELTKIHEEVLRDTLNGVIAHFSETEPRGEMVVMLEGVPEEILVQQRQSEWSEMELSEHMDLYLKQGFNEKEAMKKVARDRGVGKREIYDLWLKQRQNAGY